MLRYQRSISFLSILFIIAIVAIQTYYETEAGILCIYPDRDEFLSESMGQYLIYLEQ
jgi:hypothetical protein